MYENDKKYDTLEKKGEGSLKIHEVIEIPNIKYDSSLKERRFITLTTLNRNATYRQFSNIRRTQSQNINVSRLVLTLSLLNPLKPGVKLRAKMQLEQRRQAMLQLHLSDQQFSCLLRCVLY